VKSEPGPLTIGAAASARVRLIGWCEGFSYQVEPDPAELPMRHVSNTAVLDFRE
jgi:hypothetical protein